MSDRQSDIDALNGYNLSNNHHIDLKVVLLESEEHFTYFR